MGRLSTHVLDTAAGRPASGLTLRLFRHAPGAERQLILTTLTNKDGRCDGPLLEGDALQVATYELEFDVANYFARGSYVLTDPPFLDVIILRFTVTEPQESYHIPLLVSPWSYASYRGS